MTIKQNLMAGIVLSLVLGPLPAAANNHGLLPGLIIGGIIGSELQRNNRQNRRQVQRSRLPSTVQGQQIQTSLNYFGFPAGVVDGQLGRKSRVAMSGYQAHMGFPVTGQLTVIERDFLVNSYERAIIGGAATAQLLASSPNGPRGLLTAYRNELTGVDTTVAPANNQVTVLQTEPEADTALPDFFGGNGAVSLASQCNKVSLLTSSNGGFTTEVSMVDPVFTLNEQLCLARTYAIAQGEDLARKVQGFTPQQIAAQCETFGPAMREYVTALSLTPMDAVMQDVSGFVLRTGMSPAQLSGTARICLSVGYRTDDLDVAIGSALLLSVLGEKPYGEVIGHHLGLGYGTTERPDLALAWYEMGLDAIDNGADAVFAPGQPERNSLIRKAAFSMNGQGDNQNASGLQPVALPDFSNDDG
ncbi:MAG: peptidoglycan-binding domain-containing protein [Paracoccaceae bacterium]